MAKIVLILGGSGTGKSASLRNMNEFAYINVSNKSLPFRKQKNQEIDELITDDKDDIMKFVSRSKSNKIIIDDCQYLMGFNFLRRVKEKGWDKFNDIQGEYFEILDYCMNLKDDNKIIYFLSHIDITEDGRTKIKTIGKMLDEKLCVEGMFTIVMNTLVNDGKYYFTTQNSGMNTAKSPMGMFTNYTIDNDLQYVDDTIRNYYYLEGHKTDEIMALAHEKVKGGISTPEETKSRKKRNKAVSDDEGDEPKKERKTRTKKSDDVMEQPDEEIKTGTLGEEPEQDEEPPKRKRRTRTDDVVKDDVEDSKESEVEEPPKKRERKKRPPKVKEEPETLEKITDDFIESENESEVSHQDDGTKVEVKTRRRRKVEVK